MFSVVRENGLQGGPESPGVILFSDMDQLMNEDVIDDGQGSHDYSPAKRKSIISRTGAPPGPGVCYPYRFREQMKPMAVVFNSSDYFLFCLCPIPLDKKIPCPL